MKIHMVEAELFMRNVGQMDGGADGQKYSQTDGRNDKYDKTSVRFRSFAKAPVK